MLIHTSCWKQVDLSYFFYFNETNQHRNVRFSVTTSNSYFVPSNKVKNLHCELGTWTFFQHHLPLQRLQLSKHKLNENPLWKPLFTICIKRSHLSVGSDRPVVFCSLVSVNAVCRIGCYAYSSSKRSFVFDCFGVVTDRDLWAQQNVYNQNDHLNQFSTFDSKKPIPVSSSGGPTIIILIVFHGF